MSNVIRLYLATLRWVLFTNHSADAYPSIRYATRADVLAARRARADRWS